MLRAGLDTGLRPCILRSVNERILSTSGHSSVVACSVSIHAAAATQDC